MNDNDLADITVRPSIWSLTNIIAMVLLVSSAMWMSWWFIERSNFVYVNDAHIASDMISLSSRTPGLITTISIKEGQEVKQGERLVLMDDRDIQLKLKGLEADLATVDAEYARQQSQLKLAGLQIDSGIKAERSRLSAVNSGLEESLVVLNQSEHDFERSTRLLDQKLISDETWELRKVNRDTASQLHLRRLAEVAAAKAELLAAEASVGELEVLTQSLAITEKRREKYLVEREQLQKTLDDHSIYSPIDGIIDEVFVHPGEYVYPGQRIMMIHNPAKKWVKANIKETDVRFVKAGNHVSIEVDAWPDHEFEGTIERIGNAATSQFALLPSPNPSGNFTKITQRLEIKVNIDDPEALLKPGMMVELAIHR